MVSLLPRAPVLRHIITIAIGIGKPAGSGIREVVLVGLVLIAARVQRSSRPPDFSNRSVARTAVNRVVQDLVVLQRVAGVTVAVSAQTCVGHHVGMGVLKAEMKGEAGIIVVQKIGTERG